MSISTGYKIVPKVIWNTFINSGAKEWKGFGNDLKDGYIHLSTRDQLYNTYIRRNKMEEIGDFNLIAINLGVARGLKWQIGKNGFTYPHLYSTIDPEKDVMWVIGLENEVIRNIYFSGPRQAGGK